MAPGAWKKWKKKVKGVYIQNIPKNGKKINSPKQQYEVMENCFVLGEKERKQKFGNRQLLKPAHLRKRKECPDEQERQKWNRKEERRKDNANARQGA